MATITGFTSERMLEIENESITTGAVVGDDLILETRAGTPVNAGNVRGPIGSPGVTEAELDDFMLNMLPIGAIVDYIGTVAPTRWLGMVGQTIVDGQTLHPEFWSKLPAAMQSGSDILMPDTRGRMSVGLDAADSLFDTIGKVGGSKNAVNVSHNHTGPSHTHSGPSHNHTTPNHTHTISGTAATAGGHIHSHTLNIESSGSHQHSASGNHKFVTQVEGTGTGSVVTTTDTKPFRDAASTEYTDYVSSHAHGISGGVSTGGSHTHSVSGTANSGGGSNTGFSGTQNTGPSGTGATSTNGESGTNKNLPPFITFMKIIKVE